MCHPRTRDAPERKVACLRRVQPQVWCPQDQGHTDAPQNAANGQPHCPCPCLLPHCPCPRLLPHCPCPCLLPHCPCPRLLPHCTCPRLLPHCTCPCLLPNCPCPADLFSHIDPYVAVWYGDHKLGCTVAYDNQPNPVWNEVRFAPWSFVGPPASLSQYPVAQHVRPDQPRSWSSPHQQDRSATPRRNRQCACGVEQTTMPV